MRALKIIRPLQQAETRYTRFETKNGGQVMDVLPGWEQMFEVRRRRFYACALFPGEKGRLIRHRMPNHIGVILMLTRIKSRPFGGQRKEKRAFLIFKKDVWTLLFPTSTLALALACQRYLQSFCTAAGGSSIIIYPWKQKAAWAKRHSEQERDSCWGKDAGIWC